MAGHSRSRFSCKSRLYGVSAVPARARACPSWCTRLVPAARCLFCKEATDDMAMRPIPNPPTGLAALSIEASPTSIRHFPFGPVSLAPSQAIRPSCANASRA
jgi:hypothetical protein